MFLVLVLECCGCGCGVGFGSLALSGLFCLFGLCLDLSVLAVFVCVILCY